MDAAFKLPSAQRAPPALAAIVAIEGRALGGFRV